MAQSDNFEILGISNISQDYSFQESPVNGIPLPNELPPLPQVSTQERRAAPGSFESVLNQNQDLMTRLSVTLRSNVDLEKQLGQLIERNRYLELQAQAVHSEMSQMSEINRDLELEFVTLRSQRDSAERSFAEFQTEAMARIERMANQLVRFSSYRRKIKTKVRPAIDQMNSTLHKERAQFSFALKQNQELLAQVEQFKKQLSEAYARIQAQHTEYEIGQKNLATTYEAKVNFYAKELEHFTAQSERLEALTSELEEKNLSLIKAQADYENRAIVAERRYEGHRVLSDEKIAELRDVVAKLTSENATQRINADTAAQQIHELTTSVKSYKEECQSLRDQFEGLQILWDKLSKEAEDAQLKSSGLQKLNRDLSQALSEHRRESAFLKDQLEQQRKNSAESMQKVFEYIKSFANSSNATEARTDEERENLIKRIEGLIHEANKVSLP